MYSITSGPEAAALGAPPYLDSPEYTTWFASHPEWKRTVRMGASTVVAWSPPDGIWLPTVGVQGGAVPEPRPPTPPPPIAPAVQPPAMVNAAPSIAPSAAQMRTAVTPTPVALEANVSTALVWPTTTEQWGGFLRTWGLTPDVAVRALALGHYVQQYTGRQLVITSGLRSATRQAELLAAWKRGDPSVRSKPASDSYHLKGLAFDAVYADGSDPDTWVGQIANLLGLRWGATFGDRVHFDTAVTKS